MNIAEDEYYTPILLSIPATSEGTPTFLAALVDTLCDKTTGRPFPFLIIHLPAVTLATATAGDRRTLMHSLSGWIDAGRLAVWDAGYAGAAVDLLNDEELSYERRWAKTNPWKYGFGVLLDAPRTATTDAAQRLTAPGDTSRCVSDSTRHERCGSSGEAVCLGYTSPPRPGSVQ